MLYHGCMALQKGRLQKVEFSAIIIPHIGCILREKREGVYTLYLKALEIQGFKSFPDKTVLTFGEEMTAIVGPNGAGKSNISDALRWVMGEQSTRTLRGGKMEDVIFGGTLNRKQTGYAQVSLVLDNSQQILPMEESEVMVTRRYYRSGESEYYINRHQVRLKDVNELFMDTGLGREGYSMIGQGKIDEILSLRSGDRREIFEEAAGISRYRHRKEEAERKLERTEQNLVRIADKIGELSIQVEPLRQQAQQAKQYLVLRDELRTLELSVWVDALERIRSNTIRLGTDYKELSTQLQEVERSMDAAFGSAENMTEQMHQKEMEVEQLRGELQKGEETLRDTEAAIAVLHSRLEHHTQRLEQLTQEQERKKTQCSQFSEQIHRTRERIATLEEQLRQQRQQSQQAQQSTQEGLRQAGVLGQEIERLRQQEQQQLATVAKEKEGLSALYGARERANEQAQQLHAETAQLEEQLQKAGQQIQNQKQLCEQVEHTKQHMEQRLNQHREQQQKREAELTEQEQACTQLQQQLHNIRDRIQLLTEMEQLYEGYSKAVKLVMQAQEQGKLAHIHGTVAQLIQVQEPYAIAIEFALGNAVQHLVVDTEEDGKQVITYLKKRQGGRATILPLSAVRPRTFPQAEEISKETGFVGVADSLVTCANAYRTVLSSLLGQIVIADTLDNAISIAKKYRYQFRIVTLDGQIIHPSGSMTGGSVQKQAGILSRAKEREQLEQQCGELEQQQQTQKLQLEQMQSLCQQSRTEEQTLVEQMQLIQQELVREQEKYHYLTSSQEQLQTQQTAHRQKQQAFFAQQEQGKQQEVAFQKRIVTLEAQLDEIRTKIQEKSVNQSQLQEASWAASQQLAQWNSQIAALETERDGLLQRVRELEGQAKDTEDQLHQSKQESAQMEQEMNQFQQEKQQKGQEVEQWKKQLQTLKERILQCNQEKLVLEGERLKQTRLGQEKNKELLNLSGEASRLEQKKLASALEEKQILDKMWETYEVSHEAARRQKVELESIPKATRRIGELKKDIAALGAVNVGAIDEFQRVNERYTYLTDQRDDVEQSKRELEEVIRQITKEMKGIFAREFEKINAAFVQTFRELFGGGTARLELEDPQDILHCGIEIRVQPPGKALKTLTLLSGGEKAFVAIALYFAILKVRPTPFVVMDEIEAALDDTNVQRFAEYVRTMTEKTQFIIITHRRGTMEEADVLYGVTMQEQGISRILTLNLNEVEKSWGIR